MRKRKLVRKSSTCTPVVPIANTCSIGYPHDGRADNTAYRHDRRADNAAYRILARSDDTSSRSLACDALNYGIEPKSANPVFMRSDDTLSKLTIKSIKFFPKLMFIFILVKVIYIERENYKIPSIPDFKMKICTPIMAENMAAMAVNPRFHWSKASA